jgi:ribosomal protein S18 acetylase RimI-like enzyme
MVLIRDVDIDDVPFLWLMLTYAASMTPPGEPSVAAAMQDDSLRTYVEGWGRPGDVGVVAVRNGGERVGAAWLRPSVEKSAFKVGDAEVPELATAMLPSDRGQGIGSEMLKQLVARARALYPAIVLTVRESNPAVRFYERLGFRIEGRLRNRVGGTSLAMRLDLGRTVPHPKQG